MQSISQSNPDHYAWVLVAKGIGILFVVIEHFYPEGSPAYWVGLRNSIYTFHMPLFFILSGYLYTRNKYSYRELLKNKVRRLLYPFISIAGSFFLIKYLAGQLFRLEHGVHWGSLYALFTDPVTSYMPLLWFVHTLFIIFALYPLANRFLNNGLLLLILIAVNVLLGDHPFPLDKVLIHLPFFIFGVLLRENHALSKITIYFHSYCLPAYLTIFVLGLFARELFSDTALFAYPIRFLLRVSGSLFIINLSAMLTRSQKFSAVLQHIGYYSMSIYLF
ncbi:MAG: acyltransferase family protein, partial [Candidatus Omnitrophica bacterium]|nr:acyltransferase family protein [Candidatus Omnitrophota bacterium]